MINTKFWQEIEDYDTEIFGVFRNQGVAKPVTDFISRGKVVADLGCGPGQSFSFFSPEQQLFAVDASPELLSKAKTIADKQGLNHISFIQADMAEYKLPDPADHTLISMSFFPDGLHHAVQILTNIQQQTLSNGNIMLISPSMESRLYKFHLWYRWNFEQGESEEELQGELRDIYNHILTYGYFHNPAGEAHGQLIKEWIKEELYDLLAGMRFKNIKIKKYILPWEVYCPEETYFHDHKPLWFWQVTMVNP